MSGNEDNPLVSVIINCYNGEKFLKEAIDSVFSQTYTNWEIIFWDNRSTDRSAAIATGYGEKVRYFLAEKLTPLGAARNLALQKVNGKYICFIDCDDIWACEKLAQQISLMELHEDVALCYGGIEEIYTNGQHFRYVPTIYTTGYLLNELLYQYDVNILTSMVRTSVLKETGLSFDENITASEEYCLFMQLACSYKIGVSKKYLAKYRVYDTSLTSKSLNVLGKERRYTLDKIVSKYPDLYRKYTNAFKEAYARADYYDSRWHIANGEKWAAFKLLSRNAFINFRYFVLMAISLLPASVWNKIHLKYRNRV